MKRNIFKVRSLYYKQIRQQSPDLETMKMTMNITTYGTKSLAQRIQDKAKRLLTPRKGWITIKPRYNLQMYDTHEEEA